MTREHLRIGDRVNAEMRDHRGCLFADIYVIRRPKLPFCEQLSYVAKYISSRCASKWAIHGVIRFILQKHPKRQHRGFVLFFHQPTGLASALYDRPLLHSSPFLSRQSHDSSTANLACSLCIFGTDGFVLLGCQKLLLQCMPFAQRLPAGIHHEIVDF